MRVLWLLVLTVLIGTLPVGDAPAQVLPDLGGGQSVEDGTQPTALELRTLIELLEDERIRTWLREQAQSAAPIVEESTATMTFSEWVGQYFTLIEQKVAVLADAFMAAPAAFDRAVTIIRIELDQRPYTILISVLIFLSVGYALEWSFYKAVTRNAAIRAYFYDRKRTAIDQLKMNLYRMLIDSLTVVAFALGSVGAFLLTPRTLVFEILVVTYLSVFVLVRFASALGRFALAPWENTAHLRLVRISTAKARFIHRWMQVMTFLGSFGLLTAEALDELGLAPEVAFLTRRLTVAVLVAFLLFGRVLYRRLSRREGELRGVIGLWVSVVLLPIAWLAWVLGAAGVAAALAAAILLPPAFRACGEISAGLTRLAPPAVEDDLGESGEAADKANAPVPLIATVIERGVRGALVLIAGWLVLGTFGSDAAGFARPVMTFLAAYVLADVIWGVARHAIDRRLADEAPVDAHGGGEGGGGSSGSRLGTLLPLVRNFLLIVLVAVVILIAFASVGIDIAPLLAGAGVAGIAIGFGAQSLVRDIFSGVFFLLDDAFRLGEYVEIDQLRGTVEGISIRSMRLRHHRGAVHTIPFGEIRSITNYSRDWVIMKLEFNVPFDTDVMLVKKLVKELGKELMADPMVGPGILEPLKSQGVRRVEEFNMVIGVKFMTKPGEQWVARREVYQRILQRFRENGIRLASRDVQVQVPAGLSEEEQQRAAMAATQMATERAAPAGGSGD